MPQRYATWTPPKTHREPPTTEHRCSNCYTPGFGISAIPCKNDQTVDPLARAKAFLALRAQINRDERES